MDISPGRAPPSHEPRRSAPGIDGAPVNVGEMEGNQAQAKDYGEVWKSPAMVGAMSTLSPI